MRTAKQGSPCHAAIFELRPLHDYNSSNARTSGHSLLSGVTKLLQTLDKLINNGERGSIAYQEDV